MEAEVTLWRDEARKLLEDVDGNPLVCRVVLFLGTRGESFDMVVM